MAACSDQEIASFAIQLISYQMMIAKSKNYKFSERQRCSLRTHVNIITYLHPMCPAADDISDFRVPRRDVLVTQIKREANSVHRD